VVKERRPRQEATCWRKIRTPRQAHSMPNEAGLTRVMNPKVCQSIFLKLTKDEK
jgi:RES domain-containing protein